MEKQLKIHLMAISNAIDEIEIFIHDISGFDDLRNDLRTQRAIERNLETIGTAIKRIMKKDPSINFANAAELLAIRKALRKAREETYDQTLWGLIRRRAIQFLKKEVDQFLNQRL
jgi:uncharacterized protein with HEPN domain